MKKTETKAPPTRERRHYDETFKRHAVDLTLQGARRLTEIAHELGVPESMLYLKSYRSQIEAYTNLDTFFRFYNDQRPHSAFGIASPKTPMEIYRQRVALAINQ